MKIKKCLRCDVPVQSKRPEFRLCDKCRQYANDIENSDKYYDDDKESEASRLKSLTEFKGFWNP